MLIPFTESFPSLAGMTISGVETDSGVSLIYQNLQVRWCLLLSLSLEDRVNRHQDKEAYR